MGPRGGDPLLLIIGTGGQLIHWPGGFGSGLAARGFRVARFDNRDAGLSTHLDSAPVPHILNTLLRAKSAAVYGLDDMADDAVAVLDALAWPAAHVAGISMGGMIAQTMAIRHPTRVRTLISIGSTPYWRIGRQRVSVSLRTARSGAAAGAQLRRRGGQLPRGACEAAGAHPRDPR